VKRTGDRATKNHRPRACKAAADLETAIRATLASGVDMLKTAKMHGIGCGTVQRISRERLG
jgi:hypothetical protein